MNSIRCPQCNFLSFATATECKRCKLVFQTAGAETSQFQPQFSENEQFDSSGFSPNYAPSNDFHQNDYQNFNSSNEQNGYNYNRQSPPGFRAGNQSQKKKLAIISLVAGILSFPFVNFIFIGLAATILGIIFGTAGAVIGVILGLSAMPIGLISGIVAVVKANKSPLEYGGKSLAITGIVLSGFSFLIVPVVGAIAIPNLLAARKAANEGAAISTIRTIAKAEYDYMAGQSANYTRNCLDLAQLGNSGIIDPVLSNKAKSGYQFVFIRTVNGCEITAMPTVTDGIAATGTRSFYASSDDGWQIRASQNNKLPATINDAPINSSF